MRATFTRAALGVAGGLLLLVGLLLVILPGKGEERTGSAFSAGPDGLRAAFLLLQGLGFEVVPWNHAPGRLAGHGELLLLGRIPEHPPVGPAPAPAGAAGAPAPARSRDLLHYRRFLDEGGTLLLTGVAEKELEFVRDELGLGQFGEFASESLSSGSPMLELASGEELELANPPARRLVAPASADIEVLARAQDGSIVALSRAVGAGRLVLLTLPVDVFDNEFLGAFSGVLGALPGGEAPRHQSHAELLVRLVEATPGVERILFDEYALGGWQPDSALALAFSPRLLWWSVHLLLLLVLWFWRGAWAGPFARDPEPLLAVSPLARAEGFGRTLARAGRWDTLARLLTQGTLERWAKRAGLHLATAAPGERIERAAIEAGLRALTRGDGRLLARARACFLERVPVDEGELASLDAELSALEGELFRQLDRRESTGRTTGRTTRKTRRGIGTRRVGNGS